MKIALLNVGTELTRGTIANGHGQNLSQKIHQHGGEVLAHLCVRDQVEEIVWALKALAAKSGLERLLVTGGLGPTSDDLTRPALAQWAGVPLQKQPALETELRQKFLRRGIPWLENQSALADVPQGFEPLDNREGTAWGLKGNLAGLEVWVAPGPPRELASVLEEAGFWQDWGGAFPRRVLHLLEAKEGQVAAALRPILSNDFDVSYRIHSPWIELGISHRHELGLQDVWSRVVEALDPWEWVCRLPEEEFPEVLHRWVEARGQSPTGRVVALMGTSLVRSLMVPSWREFSVVGHAEALKPVDVELRMFREQTQSARVGIELHGVLKQETQVFSIASQIDRATPVLEARAFLFWLSALKNHLQTPGGCDEAEGDSEEQGA